MAPRSLWRYVFLALCVVYVVAIFIFAVVPFSNDGSLPSDKVLHFVEFFLLSLLVLVTLSLFRVKEPYLLSFIVVLSCTFASEFVQLFLLQRSFSALDMVADVAGAAAGFLVYFVGGALWKSFRR